MLSGCLMVGWVNQKGCQQARYDTVYAQCMTAKGNRIGGPYIAEPVYVTPLPDYGGPRYYFSDGW
jgi:hypothetical protein